MTTPGFDSCPEDLPMQRSTVDLGSFTDAEMDHVATGTAAGRGEPAIGEQAPALLEPIAHSAAETRHHREGG
ncbi:hypothetical protein KBX37_30410 [Micromonospora sp. U56]|uniref:hypothetical protein n=1 Tax=Micromonospora sp. U56 TaxID=2824900 RepID=UPI001B371D4B|nr:hypothetical protein [Micromonospora sp. U56]MBQ0897326.1 hypothetical protein [Micromonospora sp. U56]